MSTRHAIHTLSDSTAKLVSPYGTHSGVDITIQNLGTGFVYVGNENVTTSSYGFRIPAEYAFSLELDGQDSLYCVAENNNDQVAILMVNLEN